ncbi:unnamed protein product [Amoebophrya sp. A120]|nr:unnamed protein product [Amoebophrya sp. A120]|eukprot:GSA120T00014062001.1
MAVEDVSAQPSHLEHGERAGQPGQPTRRSSGRSHDHGSAALGAVLAKQDHHASTTPVGGTTGGEPTQLQEEIAAAGGASSDQLLDDASTTAANKSQELFSSQHQRGVYLMGQLLSVGIALTTGMVVVVV